MINKTKYNNSKFKHRIFNNKILSFNPIIKKLTFKIIIKKEQLNRLKVNIIN